VFDTEVVTQAVAFPFELLRSRWQQGTFPKFPQPASGQSLVCGLQTIWTTVRDLLPFGPGCARSSITGDMGPRPSSQP
jgi:hypothetical protein